MMKKIGSVICLSFIFILLYATTIIAASDWVQYDVDHEGNVYLYKKWSIDKELASYIMPVCDKWIYSDQGRNTYMQLLKRRGRSTDGYDKLSYDILFSEIDCKNNRHRTIYTLIYDMDNKEIDSSANKTLEWIDIVPGSPRDSLRKAVCK